MGGADFPAVCKEACGTGIRKQFLVPKDEIYLNNGTVRSSPEPVLRPVVDGFRDSEWLAQTDPEDCPLRGYANWNQYRDPLAQFVGCTRDELALLRKDADRYLAGYDEYRTKNPAA